MADTMHASVRRATVSDLEAVVGLLETFGYSAEYLAHVRSRLQETAGKHSPIVLVAEVDGKIVGVTGVTFFEILERAQPQARLSVIVVAPEFRGGHIGEALVREVERLALERGSSRVEATSASSLTGAHAFWERLGYERTGFRFARRIDDEPRWPQRPIA